MGFVGQGEMVPQLQYCHEVRREKFLIWCVPGEQMASLEGKKVIHKDEEDIEEKLYDGNPGYQ